MRAPSSLPHIGKVAPLCVDAHAITSRALVRPKLYVAAAQYPTAVKSKQGIAISAMSCSLSRALRSRPKTQAEISKPGTRKMFASHDQIANAVNIPHNK